MKQVERGAAAEEQLGAQRCLEIGQEGGQTKHGLERPQGKLSGVRHSAVVALIGKALHSPAGSM